MIYYRFSFCHLLSNMIILQYFEGLSTPTFLFNTKFHTSERLTEYWAKCLRQLMMHT